MASGEGQVLVSIEDPASSQGQLNSLGWDGMGVGLGGHMFKGRECGEVSRYRPPS